MFHWVIVEFADRVHRSSVLKGGMKGDAVQEGGGQLLGAQ